MTAERGAYDQCWGSTRALSHDVIPDREGMRHDVMTVTSQRRANHRRAHNGIERRRHIPLCRAPSNGTAGGGMTSHIAAAP